MGEFRMPSLGADMEHGSIVEWRVAPGDTVHRGDIVAVIETEKSTIEVEVFEDGTIDRLVAAVGDEVEVGGVLATIMPTTRLEAGTGHDTSAPPLPTSPTPPPLPPVAPILPAVPAEPVHAAPVPTEGVVRSPLVRQLAERLGVDLHAVHGTGAHGTVTRADVERAAATSVATTTTVATTTRQADRAPTSSRVRATPRARALARSADADLVALQGSGPRGAILAADVLRAAAPRSPTPPPPTPPPPTPGSPTPGANAAEKRRAAVAALMARSKREIPHYYLDTTIDVDAATRWLAAANEQRTVHDRILPAAVLLRATVLAALAHPVVNGHWRDGAFHPSPAVHLGVAVALRGGGLLAPTIQHAEALDLDALMARLRELVGRARGGVLRGSEMTDPTITVTNIGEQGVERLYGVIYPPQVALVGFGSIVDRPWAVDGMLTVRPLVAATLSADHRVSDGHDGARFLATIDRLLQQPDALGAPVSATPAHPRLEDHP